MADTSLLFKVRAEDNATDTIKRMDVAFGTFFGNIAARAASSAMSAGRSLFGFASDAVNSASALVETQSKVDKVFGDSVGSVNAFAATAAENLGQTRTQALEAAATFGTYGRAAGLAGEDLAKFATGLVARASDMASFAGEGATVADAINSIGSALRGEFDPIEKYQVLLNETSVKSQAASMGLLGSARASTEVEKKTDAVAKAQERLNKVMSEGVPNAEDITNAQRDLADAAEDLALANERVEERQRRLNEAMQATPPNVEEIRRAEQNLEDARYSLTRATEGVGEAQRNLTEAMQATLPDAEKVREAEERLLEARYSLTQANQKLELEQRKLTAALAGEPVDAERVRAAEEKLTQARQNLIRANEKLELEQRKLALAMKGTPVDTEAVQRAEDKLTDARDKAITASERIVLAQQKVNDAIGRYGESSTQTSDARAALRDTERAAARATEDVSRAQQNLNATMLKTPAVADDVKAAQTRVRDAQWAAEAAAKAQDGAQKDLNQAMKATPPDANKVAEAQRRVQEAQRGVEQSARNQDKAQRDLTQSMQTIPPDADKIRDAQIRLEDAHRQVAEAGRRQEESQKALTAAMQTTPASVEAVRAAQIALRDAQRAAADAAERQQESQTNLTQSMAGTGVDAEKLRDAQEALAEAQGKVGAETKATTSALTPQQRVLAVNAAVMGQTTLQAGDLAKTSHELANQKRELTAQVSGLRREFGESLRPAVLTVVTALTANLMPAMRELWGTHGPAVAAAAQQMGDKVAGFITTLSNTDWPAAFARGKAEVLGFKDQAVTAFSQADTTAGKFSAIVRDLGPVLGALKEAAGTTLSDTLTVTGVVMGFLADHTSTLIKYMPALVAGYVLLKTTQIAANVVSSVSPALRLAEMVSHHRLTASNNSLAASIMTTTAAQRGAAVSTAVSTGTTVANTTAVTAADTATKRGIVSMAIHRGAMLAGAAATGVATAATWLFNVALLVATSPITLVVLGVAALVAGVLLLWNHSSGFRVFWINLWDGAKQAFEGFKIATGMGISWVQNKFHEWRQTGVEVLGFFVNFFHALPDVVWNAAIGAGRNLWEGLKWGLNMVIAGWNALDLNIGGVLGLPQIDIIPDIPHLASGGLVKATPGGTIALLGEGGKDELVTPVDRLPQSRGGGDVKISFNFRGNADTLIAQMIQKMIRDGDIVIDPQPGFG